MKDNIHVIYLKRGIAPSESGKKVLIKRAYQMKFDKIKMTKQNNHREFSLNFQQKTLSPSNTIGYYHTIT